MDDVRLQVDPARDRHSRPQRRLGAVDRARDSGQGQLDIHTDLGCHEEFIRAEVQRAQMNDPRDMRRPRESATDGGDHRRSGRLPYQHRLGLDRHDHCHGQQQDADRQRARPVPDRVAGCQRETHAGKGEHEAHQRGKVLQKHHGQFRGTGGVDEPPP